ncbi:MAG: hypothetical protein HYR72_01160 [Deltaproteobacteria bacterium]|nr:hypothetical protein [Deltaproteobacteria bacterium]MBI3390978.1 hypothetical protein [Deltaproteobacteria bacterium]
MRSKTARRALLFIFLAIGLVQPATVRAVGVDLKVTVWANANSKKGPGISTSHTIAVGAGNLFLSQSGNVFATTGPSGGIPGIFTHVKTLPNSGTNEGSAVSDINGMSYLFVGNESEEEAYQVPITGSGIGISLGTARTTDPDGTTNPPDIADTGEPADFDEAEGLAVIAGSPRFNDVNRTPFFATSFSGTPLSVNGQNFPVVDANWSGKTLLIVNEEDQNLVALIIRKNGSVDPTGYALASPNSGPFVNAPDPGSLAVTPDARFAYVHDEGNANEDKDFYRFDLQNVDSSGGTSHLQRFDFVEKWLHDGLAVLGWRLYATANIGGGTHGLFSMAMDSATGNLSDLRFVTAIDDGNGNVANGSGSRLTTLGGCLLASDSGTNLIFKICEAGAAPTLSTWGLLLCAAILLAIGAGTLGRRRLFSV